MKLQRFSGTYTKRERRGDKMKRSQLRQMIVQEIKTLSLGEAEGAFNAINKTTGNTATFALGEDKRFRLQERSGSVRRHFPKATKVIVQMLKKHNLNI